MSWFNDRLRSDNGLLVLPGAYDALSARLLARAKTEAVYCGGFAATAAQYALPDLGMLSLSEMVDLYRRMKLACREKPLIVDGDAGHGGLLNIERTVASFAHAGVSAFHLEDQVMPKRCGHLDGKDVVPRGEAIVRVRTAVQCCHGRDIAVIARTDAIAVHGFEEAIARANAFIEAGAAAAFIDAPTDIQQIEAIPALVNGAVIFNAADTGIVAPPDEGALSRLGYAAVLHPIATLLDAVAAVTERYPDNETGPEDTPSMSFMKLNDILETNAFLQREKRWSENIAES